MPRIDRGIEVIEVIEVVILTMPHQCYPARNTSARIDVSGNYWNIRQNSLQYLHLLYLIFIDKL